MLVYIYLYHIYIYIIYVCIIYIIFAYQGWVNEEKILKYGFAPAQDTRVFVCGLPGVYEKLCGYRDSTEVAPYSVLHKLGYSDAMVVKL